MLIDCLTSWLANFIMKEGLFLQENENSSKQSNQEASERALANLKQEFEVLSKPWYCTVVIVAKKLGYGMHADESLCCQTGQIQHSHDGRLSRSSQVSWDQRRQQPWW
jgi:adenosyl cobinamide kinase/adenosyl cobinamide phosphate guanylyltransferase